MINVITKENYLDLLKKINETDGTAFKLETNNRRGHVGDCFISMISEDGTNYLQGVAAAEITRTAKGLVINVDNVYVDKMCVETDFGEVLVENLINTCKKEAVNMFDGDSENIYAAMAIANSDNVAYFTAERNGFDVTSSGRKLASGKTIMIRVSKEL